MAKVFKGQVKISDIQEEFDRIVTSLNEQITKYNTALEGATSEKYSVGKPTLSANGYVLSIGGLKVLLNCYKECVLGAKVYKINDTKAIITKGIFIGSDGQTIFNLPQSTVNITNKTRMIYYDFDNNIYTTTKPTRYVGLFVNANRGTKLISTYPFDAEGIDGLKIRSGGNNAFPFNASTINNSSQGVFLRTWFNKLENWDYQEQKYYIKDTEIGRTITKGYKQYNYFMWAPLFYLPKNISNPFYNGDVYNNGENKGGYGVANQAKVCTASISRD